MTENNNYCANLYQNPFKITGVGPHKNLTFKCDLDLWPTWTDVSNGTSIGDGHLLCQIMESIHNCRSYGPNKFRLTDTQTNTQMHSHTQSCCCNNYVSLTSSGLHKNYGQWERLAMTISLSFAHNVFKSLFPHLDPYASDCLVYTIVVGVDSTLL